MTGSGEPTFVLAAGWDSVRESEGLAERGLRVVGSAGRSDVLKGPLRIRSLVASSGAERVVLTSTEWATQIVPQLFAASLALVGKPCSILDEATGTFTPLPRLTRIGNLLGLPFVSLWGLVRSFAYGTAISRYDRPAVRLLEREASSVLVIWLIRTEFQVGGSVTHLSGVMDGFKSMGLEVGLVALGQPPEQMNGLYDHLEIVEPPPAAMRALPFTDLLAVNEGAAAAARRLARRMSPSFVYQRHAPLLRVGLDVADELGVPLVLEFNGPAVWTKLNWGARVPGDALFVPMAERMERQSVSGASVCAVVSSNAGKSAIEIGGASTSIVQSPNAVRLDDIPFAGKGRTAPAAGTPVRIGWIGTFGPWHGAPVLVEAMAKLPANVTATMIGHGAEWEECREQARQLGVLDRIELPGSLPHSQAISELAKCDILASPHVPTGDTPFFGSPTKLFEFMALGLPIVASDLEQIGELFEDGRTAVLVRPGDVDDLVAGIERVLALPDVGLSLGVAARSEAEAAHTWDMRARTIVDAISPDQAVGS